MINKLGELFRGLSSLLLGLGEKGQAGIESLQEFLSTICVPLAKSLLVSDVGFPKRDECLQVSNVRFGFVLQESQLILPLGGTAAIGSLEKLKGTLQQFCTLTVIMDLIVALTDEFVPIGRAVKTGSVAGSSDRQVKSQEELHNN